MMNTRKKSPPRLVQLKHALQLSPNYRRLTFTGDALLGFPEHCATATIKLLLPQAGQTHSDYLNSLNGQGIKPLKRTYTVLNYNRQHNELQVDFALHPQAGPATDWAMHAKPGDKIAIGGPGSTKRVDGSACHYLLAADLSALSSLIANFKHLSTQVTGNVLIQIPTFEDQQSLLSHPAPPKLKIHWHTGRSAAASADSDTDHAQLRQIKHIVTAQTAEQRQQCHYWIAGETPCVVAIRQYLLNEANVDANRCFFSGYWQHGHTEDTHHRIRRLQPFH